MHPYLKLSYVTGCCKAFEKVGLERLPELGQGEREMLEDPDFPASMRQNELDSYLQRAISTPVSPEQEFIQHGKTEGTVGGGLLGGGLGALTGAGLGHLSGHAGKGALIGALGAGTLGALIGRPLGAEAGRREHEHQSRRQEELGDIFTDPYLMQRELQKHLAEGRRRSTDEDRSQEQLVAQLGAPPAYRVNYNIND